MGESGSIFKVHLIFPSAEKIAFFPPPPTYFAGFDAPSRLRTMVKPVSPWRKSGLQRRKPHWISAVKCAAAARDETNLHLQCKRDRDRQN